jgi:prophage DNA circulation protein
MIKTAFQEVEGIVKRTTDRLLEIAQKPGRAGSEVRLAVGDIQARLPAYIADGSFGIRLASCFKLATEAGMTMDWVDMILSQLVAETPTQLMAVMVVQSSVLFALAQDGRIIAATQYKSSNDVEDVLHRMKEWFDTVRDLAGNQMDDLSYRALNELAGAMTRYLADVARPLPRMLLYEISAVRPALAISQYIYGEGTRSEELAAENKIVHPGFCLRDLRALSA